MDLISTYGLLASFIASVYDLVIYVTADAPPPRGIRVQYRRASLVYTHVPHALVFIDHITSKPIYLLVP